MSWVKLTTTEHAVIWVNMRTHDYMVEEEGITHIWVHDGGSVQVIETPVEILAKLKQGE